MTQIKLHLSNRVTAPAHQVEVDLAFSRRALPPHHLHNRYHYQPRRPSLEIVAAYQVSSPKAFEAAFISSLSRGNCHHSFQPNTAGGQAGRSAHRIHIASCRCNYRNRPSHLE